METFFLGAYWGDRKESIEQCAERVLRCLVEIGQCDVACSRWFRSGRSRTQAMEREIRISFEDVKELLLRGTNRRDIGGEVIGDLGVSMKLWNGSDDDQNVSFSVHCGAHTGNPNLGNNCVVDLPAEEPTSERFLQVDMLLCLLRSVIESFDPDWATVMPRTLLSSIQFVPSKPVPGWLFYVADRVIRPPGLLTGNRVIGLPKRGNIVVVTEERFSTGRPDHLQARDALQAALSAAVRG